MREMKFKVNIESLGMVCQFSKCIRCGVYWHLCDHDCSTDLDNYEIQVYCPYCNSCQEEGCCPNEII